MLNEEQIPALAQEVTESASPAAPSAPSAPKAGKGKKSKARKAVARKPGGIDPGNLPLADLCKELRVRPILARRALRKAKFPTHRLWNRWMFASDNRALAVKIIKGQPTDTETSN